MQRPVDVSLSPYQGLNMPLWDAAVKWEPLESVAGAKTVDSSRNPCIVLNKRNTFPPEFPTLRYCAVRMFPSCDFASRCARVTSQLLVLFKELSS